MHNPILESFLLHLAEDVILSLLGVLAAMFALFGRRSLARMPLVVLLRRTRIVGGDAPPLLAAPGFPNPELRVGRAVQGLPRFVRLVGLLDALALCRLQDLLNRSFPKRHFEPTAHESAEHLTRPVLSVGGASVNEVTASVISKSLLQRGVWIQYPAHIARVLEHTYLAEVSADEPLCDYGFLIFVRNQWNPEAGCCLIFGIYPSGTWSVVRLLESPMRYGLIQHLLGMSTAQVWLRLLLDRLRLRQFSELHRDWVVVVRCELAQNAIYPGEPKIVLAREIPDIPDESKGWYPAAQAEFWARAAASPGWMAVAGDEPELSTRLVRDWLGRLSFAGETLLDYGCGPGRLFDGYFSHGAPLSIVAMDFEAQMLTRAQNHYAALGVTTPVTFDLVDGDAEGLRKYPDLHFSTIICWTVLNHVIDDDAAAALLRELCGRAKSRIILCDPTCAESEEPTTSVAFPSRRRRPSFYEQVLRSEGFTVVTGTERFGSVTHPEAHRTTMIATRTAGAGRGAHAAT